MLRNILYEFISHLQKLSNFLKTIEGGMKFIAAIFVVIGVALGFGVYLHWGWWQSPFEWQMPRATVPGFPLMALLIVYLTLLIDRARQPRLDVGELMPDNSSPSFDVRIKNLGPGKVRPMVTFMLWDGKGRQFRHAPESYREREAHWRHAPSVNWRPRLRKGAEANAGVLWVDGAETDHPVLCSYPNDLKAKFPLWDQPVPLKDQNGLRVRIVASYLRSSGKGREKYRI